MGSPALTPASLNKPCLSSFLLSRIPPKTIAYKVRIGSGSGVAPNRWQAFIWTNVDCFPHVVNCKCLEFNCHPCISATYFCVLINKCVWIFMPRPLGAGGIMFLGCLPNRWSVHPSEAWNTLFPPVHGSVGPSDQPLPFYGMSVCPSVCAERFPGICWRTLGGNGLKFCMLMYHDHLQNWLD